MLNLDQAAVVVVAAEAQAAVDTLDGAYVAHLRMSAEAVDGLRNSGLPIAQTGRFMTQLFEGQTAALAWRKHTQSAISTLQVIHRHSNQAEVDIGCPMPWASLQAEVSDDVPSSLALVDDEDPGVATAS